VPRTLAIPVEGYALFPPIIALATLGIDRSELPSLLKFLFFVCVIAATSFVTRKNSGAIVVFFAVLLERSLFFHPIVSYGIGVGYALSLYLTETREFQPRVGSLYGLLFILGLFPLLAPNNIVRFLPLALMSLALVQLVGMLARGRLTIIEVAVNPRDYLFDPVHTPNVGRLHLFSVFFLVVGGAVWGQLVELVPFQPAALIYVAISLFVPAALVALFDLPFKSLRRDVLLPVPVDNSALMKAREEAERLRIERERLLGSERRFFFGQSWDELVGQFSNKLETRMPDGSTIQASDHLLIGLSSQPDGDAFRYKPVFLHRPILNEHIHILGGTGSGKTSRAITPIAIQLIRGHAVPGGHSEPLPIVIFDIKGDLALFHTVREEAQRRGQDFLFFTVNPNSASYYFNPFLALRRHKASPSEQAHQLLDALSLNHGEFYGASYFTRMGRQALLSLLKEGETPQSFEDLYLRLKNDPKKQKKAEELFAALEGLMFYPQLFTTREQEERDAETIIDFDRVLERNQVVYFSLTAPLQSIAVREIGKLAIYSYFMAAIHRYSQNRAKQTYLIIDEFQRLVGENLAQVLELAREFGIGAILANQTNSQLDTRDGNLWSLVNSSVRASLHFGSADPDEKKLLSQAAGEVIEELRSTTVSRTGGDTSGYAMERGSAESTGVHYSTTESRSVTESRSFSRAQSEAHTRQQIYRPRLTFESIGEWWNKRGRFFCWVRAGSGLSDFEGRPIKAEGLYTTDLETHKKRKTTPWPDGPRPSLNSRPSKPVKNKRNLLAEINENFNDE
jgi:hypothetical protein